MITTWPLMRDNSLWRKDMTKINLRHPNGLIHEIRIQKPPDRSKSCFGGRDKKKSISALIPFISCRGLMPPRQILLTQQDLVRTSGFFFFFFFSLLFSLLKLG